MKTTQLMEKLKKEQESKKSVKEDSPVKKVAKRVVKEKVQVVEDVIIAKSDTQPEIVSDDVFQVEVDEKFDAPEVPFSSVDDAKN